jgi:hypothetical protein
MQADPTERSTATTDTPGLPLVPLTAGIVVVVALAAWYFTGSPQTEAPVTEPAPPVAALTAPEEAPEPELAPAPDIPEAPPTPAPEPEAAAEPAPTLENSDAVVRRDLSAAISTPLLGAALLQDNLLERGVAIIDGLSRGVVRYKLLPLAPLEGQFLVKQVNGQIRMDPAGYSRFDSYAAAIAALDIETLVASFHRYRSLLEEAYGILGYEPQDMDNALIRGLDRIIATPVLQQPPALVKVEAVYKYADPELEQLTELQKQLLRAGPGNTARIQASAQALRSALLRED